MEEEIQLLVKLILHTVDLKTKLRNSSQELFRARGKSRVSKQNL
jgi:hypothetical protein